MKIYSEEMKKQQEAQAQTPPVLEHESDLSRSEKRKRERARFKSMTAGEKLQYFWDYYKWTLVVLIFLVIFIREGISIYHSVKQIKLFSVGIVDVPLDMQGEAGRLSEDLIALLGSGNPDETVLVDASFLSGDTVSAVTKLAVSIGAGTVDVLICGEETYRAEEEAGVFLRWDEVLSQGTGTELFDLLDEEGRLDISGQERWQDYGLTQYEPAYLGLVASTGKIDEGIAFARMLCEEQAE